MEYTNKKFNQEEQELLKHMKDFELLSLDAVLAAPPDNSWNTVRLHFKNFDIDINNFLQEIVVDEFGTLEEFGLLSITHSSKSTLCIPEVGTDTTTFQINKKIQGVSVVNDTVEIYGGNELVAKLEYPQAIILNTKDNIIMFDKEVWFSETIVIKKGNCIEELLYNESINWEDEPEDDSDTHFEFYTEIVEL